MTVSLELDYELIANYMVYNEPKWAILVNFDLFIAPDYFKSHPELGLGLGL